MLKFSSGYMSKASREEIYQGKSASKVLKKKGRNLKGKSVSSI